MSEAEWMACTEPMPMLELLRGKASDRKLRLFACACCRGIWHLLTQEGSQRAVEVAERFVDGLAGAEELIRARDEASKMRFTARSIAWAAAWVVAREPGRDMIQAARQTAGVSASAVAWAAIENAEYQDIDRLENDALKGEQKKQVSLLLDIFGNPFRPVTLDPAWKTPKVLALAQSVYAKPAFERLPILADNLEEAGCSDTQVLAHCRQLGAHVRGCWVVDSILDK